MSDHSERHKQLLRRLSEISDERVLWRMQQLGYWSGTLPPDPPEELSERAEIMRKIQALQSGGLLQEDLQRALKEERKRRFVESIKRRSEQKAERAKLVAARKADYQARQQRELLHVGRGVSQGLHLPERSATANKAFGDAFKTQQLGLPALNTPEDLAAALGISLAELRWLSFHRQVAPLVHYHRFTLPKKTGGVRSISAPKPKLKRAQQWIFDNLLERLNRENQQSAVHTHSAAHGFVPARSSLSNAALHCGKKVLINLDVKDFFPSVRLVRVRELFVSFGYPRPVATVLALLATETPRVQAQVDGDVTQQKHFIAIGERALPQGACTSPALTNILCVRLDRRLTGLAQKHGFTYSRYADDLSFSGNELSKVGGILASCKRILREEGFAVHPTKTKVMHQSCRQEVTGLTVNENRPHLPRAQKRLLRAMLHNTAKHGLKAANRSNVPHFRRYLQGHVAYACMAEPERKAEWLRELALALAKD